MGSNLRATPIEGFVCDSAGNVIRNATITIRDNAPGGSNIVDSVSSDDSGYFISTPLKNGYYDIYESGVKTTKTIHTPSMHNFQCWPATADNIPSDLQPFTQLDENSDTDINKYRFYIQLENDDIDIKQNGHIFPIYDFNLHESNEWLKFYNFHGLSVDSRITLTRFDVEFFNPLTATSTSYRRMRWVGIPAISFYKNSKLVLPLDYYSMVFNKPFIPITDFLTTSVLYRIDVPSSKVIAIFNSVGENIPFNTLESKIVKGDVVKLTFGASVSTTTPYPSAPTEFYGIFVEEATYPYSGGVKALFFKELNNSNYNSISLDALQNIQDNAYVETATRYDGFFNGITNIGSGINEKFTVIENTYAQDSVTEPYNYSNS